MLVSLARARYHPEAVRVDDTLLTAALTVAEERILLLIGQYLDLAEHSEVLNGIEESRIFLTQLPVISITSMTFTDLITGDEEVVTVTDLTFDPTTGEVRFKPSAQQYFPYGWRNIEVVYNAGSADIPEIILEAIINLALSMVESLGTSNVLHLEAESFDYASSLRQVAGDGIPPLVLQMLADYRVPKVSGT